MDKKLRIYREGGKLCLIPELLARQLRITGLVVFTSGRVRQRDIAREVMALVRPEISAISGETLSPNGCMCLVDPDRFSLLDVLKEVSKIDCEFENHGGE